MLLKRGKTIKQRSVFLERVSDSEYPNACEICLLKDKKCNHIECVGYDNSNYSYIVKKKLNYGRSKNKICKK